MTEANQNKALHSFVLLAPLCNIKPWCPSLPSACKVSSVDQTFHALAEKRRECQVSTITQALRLSLSSEIMNEPLVFRNFP
jgi:hypothetical protein